LVVLQGTKSHLKTPDRPSALILSHFVPEGIKARWYF
jgi:hypothetical protein